MREAGKMKLSMWTICAELESRGLDAAASIDAGLPRISAFRQSAADSYSARYVEIVPPEQIPGAGKTGAALVNDMDYILVPNADAAQLSNCLSEIFEFYNEWERQLYSLMVEGASLQQLLDAANTAFRRPMFIKNDSSWTFAITHGYPADTHPDWARMEASVGKHTLDYDAVRTVSTDPEFQNVFNEKYPVVARSPAYGAMILHANIFLSSRRVAEIIALENGRPFNRGEVHLMHTFAELVEKYVRSNTEKLIAVSDPSVLLTALLEGRDLGETNVPDFLRSRGLAPGAELALAVIEGKNRSDTPILAVLRGRLEEFFAGAVVFSYRGQVVCLLGLGPKRSYVQAQRQLASQIPPDAFLWGLSYEFTGLDALPAYYAQASTALEQAVRSGESWATMYQIACRCLAAECRESPTLRRLVHPDLARLRRADEEEKTQYSRTLFEYLLCGGNYTDTAGRMGLHRNSLIYRMNKIRSIMHTSPDDLENRELLLFSFLIEGEE